MSWWMRLFRRSRAEKQLDSELRFHLEEQIADCVAAGMTLDEARRKTRQEFGGLDQVKEDVHEAQRGHFLETLFQDVRYGLRMLRKDVGFTMVAILTLALGIGANTAIFSLVDCLVLRPLPIAHPGRVVFLMSSWKGGGSNTAFSYPDSQEVREQTAGLFSGITASQPFQMDGVAADGNSQPMWTAYVTGNFFEVLGVRPEIGRLTLPSEGRAADSDPVLAISYSYWKSRFNADPDIVGKKVTVNRHPMTIIGVAPEGFRGLTSLLDTQGYIPLGMAVALKDAPANFFTARSTGSLALVARLRPGVDLQQAQSVLHVVAERMVHEHSELKGLLAFRALRLGPAGLAVDPGHPEVLTLVSFLFLTLAGSVLLLACMNIANLLLVRSDARQREIAMRAALGATRYRLIRSLLTESLLLAVLGGGAGVLLGLAASRAVSSIHLHTVVPIVLDFRFDWRVFSYALGAAILTGLLVGIAPALRASRGNVSEILHEGGRTSTSGRHRVRGALVAAQVGGALMLLVVAGLFARSLEHVEHSKLGFDPHRVLNATFDPHEAGYDNAQTQEFFRNLLQRAQRLPGVQSVSLAASVPMGYNNLAAALTIEGYQPKPDEGGPYAEYNVVTPGYFDTMRIPLLQGRAFLDSDTNDSLYVAIVNQAMADRYWPGQNPIGQHFTSHDDPKHSLEIVGIAGNTHPNSYEGATPARFFYVPLAQSDQSLATLQIRTDGDPTILAREVTGLIHSLEPAMPVFDVQPMTMALETLNGFLIFQFAAGLAACLGALGLVLAIVGVYGVISYSVSRRTHEIGLRIALGAQAADVLRLVFSQGLVIVGAGVLAGLVAAAGMAKIVGNFLVGVAPLDPLTYSAAALLLGLIALAACYVPAHRAMRVDPMVALRHE
jgi:putative ABC transport system permease protein